MLFCALVFNIVALAAYAQNAWTWVNGDNSVYNSGIYGSKGVAAASNKPGSRHRSTSWTDGSGNLWLFGGFGYAAGATSQVLNDLWKYDPLINQWIWINGQNTLSNPGIYGTKGIASAFNMPGSRYGALSWTDATGNLWLFGGYGFAASGTAQFLNDLWKYNPLTNEWTWMNGDNTTNMFGISGIMGITSSVNMPGSRYGGASWKDATGNFWMFGGKGYSSSLAGDLNDLWKYDPASNQWTWVNGDNTINNQGAYGSVGIPSNANKPGSRYLAACWVDANGKLWLFGGEGYANTASKGHLNDLWMYDLVANEWTWKTGDNTINNTGVYGTKGVPSTSNKPGARQGIAAWTDGAGDLWLFGGYISTSLYFNDMWKYSPATNEWTWQNGDNITNQFGNYGTKGVSASGNMPGSRYVTATWKDNAGRCWLFGGEGFSSAANGYLNDLWVTCILSGSITPVSSSICPGATQTLTTSGGSNYQWSLDGVPIPGATFATYKAGLPGLYMVIISNGTCSTAANNSAVIAAFPMPVGSILPATASICGTGTQMLTSSGGTSYQWSLDGIPITRAIASTYNAGTTGIYTVIISNGSCSTAATNSAVITITTITGGVITPATSILCAGATQLLSTSGGPFFQWSLNGTPISGATSSTFIASIAGNYTVISGNGTCSATSVNTSVLTTASSPIGSITPASASLCTGEQLLLTCSGGTSYQWMFNGVPITGETAATYTAILPGTYSVIITNATCSAPATNTVFITTASATVGSVTPAIASICEGASQILTATAGTSYQWKFNGLNINGATSSAYIAKAPGSYSVIINNNACVSGTTADAVITTASSIKGIRYPPVLVPSNAATTLTARNIGKKYQWDPPVGLNDPSSRTPVIITSFEKEYKIAITTQAGCITVDTVIVKPYGKSGVFVPTAFTPNGDNKDDILRPICMDIPIITLFTIYNRWGNLVYKTANAGAGWDGRVSGINQPPGSYVWIFEGRDSAGNTIRAKGLSILIR
ncbi:MAG: kelch repeat-containing protein [Chitinophagaceae bacterium]